MVENEEKFEPEDEDEDEKEEEDAESQDSESCVEIRIDTPAERQAKPPPGAKQEESEEESEEKIEEVGASLVPEGEDKLLSRMETEESPEDIEPAKIEEEAKPAKSTRRKSVNTIISCALFAAVIVSAILGYYFHSCQGVAYYIEKLKSEDAAMQSHARDSLS